jgi:hypothetical protein
LKPLYFINLQAKGIDALDRPVYSKRSDKPKQKTRQTPLSNRRMQNPTLKIARP